MRVQLEPGRKCEDFLESCSWHFNTFVEQFQLLVEDAPHSTSVHDIAYEELRVSDEL